MSVPYEAIDNWRDFGVCSHCGYEGIGWVTLAGSDYGPDVWSFDCDICERQSDWSAE